MNQTELDLLRDLAEMFSKNSNEWRDDDLCLCKEKSHPFLVTYREHSQGCVCEPLWVPDLCSRDRDRPERGLEGMASVIFTDGWMLTRCDGKEGKYCFSGRITDSETFICYGENPYVVFLFALK